MDAVEAARLALDDASADIAADLCEDWRFWARPSQWPPEGAWRVWLLLAGRGFGKTRCGAEFVRARVAAGHAKRVALVAPTAADARDVMVEGESGLLNISPDDARPLYEPSKRRLSWANGAVATLFSADEPDRLRGPQFDLAWCDELAAWRYDEAWTNLMLGLRLGDDPRAVVTTTPKPRRLLRELIADPNVAVTRGTTYENANNLAPAFLDAIVKRYEGTRIGRQELDAELLEDAEGALWTRSMIEAARVVAAPSLKRIVVAIDPAVSSGDGADETGIVAAGLGHDGFAYVLADRSGRMRPHEWASRAIEIYRVLGADRIVAEKNQGGDLVEATLRVVDPSVSYKGVHATHGKLVRAEPIAALYEQGRVRHVGAYPALEDQMCAWTGEGGSPDRLDALVWAISELMLAPQGAAIIDYYRHLAG